MKKPKAKVKKVKPKKATKADLKLVAAVFHHFNG